MNMQEKINNYGTLFLHNRKGEIKSINPFFCAKIFLEKSEGQIEVKGAQIYEGTRNLDRSQVTEMIVSRLLSEDLSECTERPKSEIEAAIRKSCKYTNGVFTAIEYLSSKQTELK